MDLIHIERTQSAHTDRQLTLALERRNKAAERYVEASTQTAAARMDLLHLLAERLQAGSDGAALRHRIVASGVSDAVSWNIMSAARALLPGPTQPAASQQEELPYGIT